MPEIQISNRLDSRTDPSGPSSARPRPAALRFLTAACAVLLLASGPAHGPQAAEPTPAPKPVEARTSEHAGTAADPIPIALGDRIKAAITEPASNLAVRGGPYSDYLPYMSAPYPLPGAVVFSLEPERGGPVAIEVRSMDIQAAVRLSRVLPDGEVLPIYLDGGEDARFLLREDVSYQVEIFDGSGWLGDSLPGEFEVVVREPAPDLWRTRWAEKSGLSGVPLWRQKIAGTDKAAARASARGDSWGHAAALHRKSIVMLQASPWPCVDHGIPDPPEFGLEDVLALSDLVVTEAAKLPNLPVPPDVRVQALRCLGRWEEAARLEDEWAAGAPARLRAEEAEARGSGDDRRLWMALRDLHGEHIRENRLDAAAAVEAEMLEIAGRAEILGNLLLAETLAVQAQGASARGEEEKAASFRDRARELTAAGWDSLEESLERAGERTAVLVTRLHRGFIWWSFPRGAPESRDVVAARVGRTIELAREIWLDDEAWFPALLYGNRFFLFHGYVQAGLRWADIEPLVERYVEIVERVYGPEDPHLIDTLWMQQWAAWQGQDSEARIAALERYLAWVERERGYAYFWAQDNRMELGSSYTSTGRLLEAVEILKPATQMQTILLGGQRGPRHSYLYQTYFELGDYETARRLIEEALGNDSSGVAGQSLAWVLVMEGRYDEAARVARETIERLEPKGHWPPQSIRMALLAEAYAFYFSERFGKALETLDEYKANVARLVNTDFRLGYEWEGMSLEAHIRWRLGQDEQAQELIDRALERWRELGRSEDRPFYSGMKALEAALLARAGSPEALPAALVAERVEREHIRKSIPILSERNALTLSQGGVKPWTLGMSGSRLGLILSVVAQENHLDPASLEASLDAVIRRRGLVLDEVGARNRALSGLEGSPEVAALQERYHDVARRTANLLIRNASQVLDEGGQRILDEALAQREKAEKALAGASLEFRRLQEMKAAGLEEFRRALPAGSALVSYQEYERTEERRDAASTAASPPPMNPPHHMAAFVSRSGATPPVFVDLGPAGAIGDAVTKWRAALADDSERLRGMGVVTTSRANRKEKLVGSAFREAGAALRGLVWDPIAAHVGDAERVFLVPDGAINLISFAGLPVGDEGWLVESRPLLHYLSAERDLVRAEQEQEEAVPDPARSVPGRTLLAMGGADFDTTQVFASLRPQPAEGRVAASNPVPVVGIAAAAKMPAVNAFRGDRSSCRSFENWRFDPLDATGIEVEEIAGLWRTAGRGPGIEKPPAGSDHDSGDSGRATTLLDAGATETAFKELAPGASVVHVATHGFFLGGGCASALDDAGRGSDGAAGGAVVQAENPLILSGLAMAGANNREHAGADEDDGILTAQEIAAMDLSSVEWAVLSACETGVGEIKAGEGVFGLRRAFQVAGADTLIMSLWSVEDEATRAWMKALYEGKLRKRLDTAEAVRHASLTILNDRREKGLSDHPFFWAAFVAAGDWR